MGIKFIVIISSELDTNITDKRINYDSFFWIEIKIFIEILRSEVFCDEIKKLYFDFNIVGFTIKEQQIMQSLRDENTNRTFSRHERGSAFFKRVYSGSSSRQSSGVNKRYKTYLESYCRTIHRKIKANRRQIFMHFDGMLLSKKISTSSHVVKKARRRSEAMLKRNLKFYKHIISSVACKTYR